MGGAPAMQIGLTHLDTFSAIGAFGGAGKVDPKTACRSVWPLLHLNRRRTGVA
jgi:hypothetical protein